MSVRLLTSRLAKHGRYFLQSYWKREVHANILEQNQKTRSRFSAPASVLRSGNAASSGANAGRNAFVSAASNVPRAGIFRFGQHARKLFIDNILNRVTTTYSGELRNQATKKLFYGDSAPFFALIGVSLASGAGVLTKEDELEGVCWEIREAAARLQSTWDHQDASETLDENFNIDKLDIGPPIAKGCAAVVYAASMKTNTAANVCDNIAVSSETTIPTAEPTQSFQPTLKQQPDLHPEMMSPIQNMSRFVHNFGGSVDNLKVYTDRSVTAAFANQLAMITSNSKSTETTENIPDGIKISNSEISTPRELLKIESSNSSISQYPFALKMMFNYDIQSNALSILRAMYKETIPARQRYMNESCEHWEQVLQDHTLTLPAHPNIVCMYGFFCDEVRNFPDGHLLYPIAQPKRINEYGYGRNMSLYLLMKRYSCSLRELLDDQELNTRTKLLLLAQLLEAIAHINRHGVAHRDIKSDNVLIELNDSNTAPLLVLSDFGCCLADKVHGLQVPYSSSDIDKGGNAALMAPEIINKQPGPFALLNYSKADLWACGAISYEIFGMPNPFYLTSGALGAAKGENTYSLRNSNYKQQDLPPLRDECPALIKQLIYNILNPNPSKRVSPDIAANIMQLYLWAPSKWLKAGGMPNSPEILQWLLSLTTKVMCEVRGAYPGDQLSYQQSGRRTYVEYLLICSFLARAHLRRIRGALNWIQNVV